MKTRAQLARQAQCELDAALAKRNRARQLLSEAEEEIGQARIKLREALRNETNKAKTAHKV